MSKKNFRTKFNEFDTDVDMYESRPGYHDQLAERRRQKKLKSALKTKNIDYLMELDEEF